MVRYAQRHPAPQHEEALDFAPALHKLVDVESTGGRILPAGGVDSVLVSDDTAEVT